MADHLIQCSIFSVKHDGAFDFSINQVFFVNKSVTKVFEIATSGNTGLNFVYCLWALSCANVIVYSCNSNNGDKFFKKCQKMPICQRDYSSRIFDQLKNGNHHHILNWILYIVSGDQLNWRNFCF